MELNESIINLLNYLREIGNSEIKKQITGNTQKITIVSGGNTLTTINHESILLFGKHNLQNKIQPVKDTKSTLDLNKIKQFLKSISGSTVRLNHIGISYACENFDKEIKKYKELLEANTVLFQEESGNKDNQWFFIGDKEKKLDPLFEIVLNNPKKHYLNQWIPHFQIDIDTELDAEQIESELIKYLGRGFDWKIDVPNIGIALGIQILGNIGGTKLCLGIATPKRGFEYHRKKMLKEL